MEIVHALTKVNECDVFQYAYFVCVTCRQYHVPMHEYQVHVHYVCIKFDVN